MRTQPSIRAERHGKPPRESASLSTHPSMGRFARLGGIAALLLALVAGGVTGAAFADPAAPAPSADLYPSYNTSPIAADMSGMGADAKAIAAQIRVGWNVGNTLEAVGGETAWGNPKVNAKLIRLVKQSGFNAIRLPTAWDQYADPSTGKISATWLKRVKEIVQDCVDNDVYVILNIHWDGGWLENNVTAAKQVAVNARQKAYWEQIATYLRDIDQHLLFASANEPNVEDAGQMAVLMSYHQTFVDTVRATGGRNAYRVLVVQGPSTDIDKTAKLMSSMPTDKVAGRMMAEVHFYSPYNFALMSKDEDWGKQFYYWGAPNHSATDPAHNPVFGEEAMIDTEFASLKRQFIDKGIPVVLGEFAAMRRTNLTGEALKLHLASRNYYHHYIVQRAIANGVVPFYWDVGAQSADSGGIFDRNTNTVRDQAALDSLMK